MILVDALVDALVACFIFKMFGENGLWVLAITCAITVMRTCVNVNGFFSGLAMYASDMIENEEEEN